MKKILNILILLLFITGTILLTWNAPLVRASDVFPYVGIIHADSLVVYKGEKTSSGTLTELAYGTRVTVLGDVDSNSKFYKISFEDGTIGYTWKSYITDVSQARLNSDAPGSGIEKYEDYCNKLVSGGFDKSYCPYLYKLHTKYPHWQFVADRTGLTLEEVAKNETGKVVLQTGNKNYWNSSKPIEGNYYYVNESVVRTFMDPRNSLYEKQIFQFLDLELSKDIANDESLFYISGQNGNLRNYVEEFKAAGVTNQINPLHIMARSAQEGANQTTYDKTFDKYVASYSAVTGLYTTSTSRTSAQGYSLDGYYNFFNIGSYADANYPYTVQRGLAHAAGFIGDEACITVETAGKAFYDETKCAKLSYQRPWNTVAKAISGGSEFIADGYVRKGQDSLYYQKFNVSSYTSYKKYTHQYMTNIHAPASEAGTMYGAYNSGSLLNSEFVFVIPVYENMPEDVYQAVDKNSNSKLGSVTINDKNYNEFDSDVTEYNYNLITESDTFKIGAKTEESTSSIVGTGDYKFENGVSTVKLEVTAENGNVTTYVINVKKVLPVESVTVNDVVSKIGVKIDGNVMYGISPDTVVSTLVNTVTKNKGEAIVTDATGKTKNSGAFVTGDKITIKGTNDKVVYEIAVRGDINGDGIVNLKDFVLVQSHILDKSKLDNIKFYAGDINYDGKIVLADFVLIQSHILKKNSL